MIIHDNIVQVVVSVEKVVILHEYIINVHCVAQVKRGRRNTLLSNQNSSRFVVFNKKTILQLCYFPLNIFQQSARITFNMLVKQIIFFFLNTFDTHKCNILKYIGNRQTRDRKRTFKAFNSLQQLYWIISEPKNHMYFCTALISTFFRLLIFMDITTLNL